MTAQISSQPVDVPDRRGSDYSELSRRVKAAGLLGRRPGYYRWKIGATAALLASGWVLFVVLGQTWWQLVTAAFLGVMFTQIGFLGHDSGHKQVFRTRWATYAVRPDRRQRGHRPELRLVDGQAQPAPRAPERPRARSRRARRCPGLRRPPGRQPARLRRLLTVDPGLPVHPDAAPGGPAPAPGQRAGPAQRPGPDRGGSRDRCCCCTCRRTSRSSRWCCPSGRRWRSSPCSRASSASTWASRSPRTTRGCRWSAPRTTGTTCAGR